MPIGRRFLAAVAAVIAAATFAACSSPDGPTTSAPSAPTLSTPPASSAPSAPQLAPGPVLLIPGYGGGTAMLAPAAAALRATGRSATFIDIGNGQGDLTAYADLVVARANELVAAGAPSVDLVGFSAGGVIARLAQATPDGQRTVRKIVTVGSPHHGTLLASLGASIDQCPAACQQLTPGSTVLTSLPVTASADQLLSIWSESDDVVRPPRSSHIGGAAELVVQDLCDRNVGHIALMSDPLVLQAIDDYLANGTEPTTCAG